MGKAAHSLSRSTEKTTVRTAYATDTGPAAKKGRQRPRTAHPLAAWARRWLGTAPRPPRRDSTRRLVLDRLDAARSGAQRGTTEWIEGGLDHR